MLNITVDMVHVKCAGDHFTINWKYYKTHTIETIMLKLYRKASISYCGCMVAKQLQK